MSYLRLALSALLLLALAACGKQQTPSEGTQTPTGNFFVDVGMYGEGFNATRTALVKDASERWEQVVVGDLPDLPPVRIEPGTCDPTDQNGNKITQYEGSDPGYTGPIDDIRIQVSIKTIDGAGTVLGFAIPCLRRPGTTTIVYGLVVLDSADVDLMSDETFRNVVLHEMGHVLGIGGLWDPYDYITHNDPDCMKSTQVDYIGPDGVGGFATSGTGDNSLPVEDNQQPGTACSHWDEETFDDELMTGRANVGPNPLSTMTVGALADLGYEVNFDAADPYSAPVGPLGVRSALVEDRHTELFGPLPSGTGFTPLD